MKDKKPVMTLPIVKNFDGPPPDEHPLATWRLNRRVSVKDLANALGVNRVTVANWEKRITIPKPELIAAIARLTKNEVTLSAWVEEPKDDEG